MSKPTTVSQVVASMVPRLSLFKPKVSKEGAQRETCDGLRGSQITDTSKAKKNATGKSEKKTRVKSADKETKIGAVFFLPYGLNVCIPLDVYL